MGSAEIPTYLEIGAKRTFAGALDWPGWCRAGRDEAAALEALDSPSSNAYKAMPPPTSALPRSHRRRMRVRSRTPSSAVSARSCARAGGRSTPRPTALEARHSRRARAAAGETGGRSSTTSWTRRAATSGWWAGGFAAGHAEDLAERIHAAVLEALETTARHGPPPPGPRGGTRWLPRYFVRRVTWHVLDQAWEIEDRAR
jgi:hypothetical protein